MIFHQTIADKLLNQKLIESFGSVWFGMIIVCILVQTEKLN